MTNLELIKQFNKGSKSGHTTFCKEYNCHRLSINDDALINYHTIIALRTKRGIILNKDKYSRTTSKLQTMIRNYCDVVNEVSFDEIYDLMRGVH